MNWSCSQWSPSWRMMLAVESVTAVRPALNDSALLNRRMNGSLGTFVRWKPATPQPTFGPAAPRVGKMRSPKACPVLVWPSACVSRNARASFPEAA